MTTWLEFTNRVRRKLEDTTTPYEWSQDELHDYYRAFCQLLAVRLPRETVETVEAVSGTASYALDASTRDVVLVLSDNGRYEQTLPLLVLERNSLLSEERVGYTFRNGMLTLHPTPTEALTLTVEGLGRYSLPDDGDDDAHELSIPEEVELAADYYLRYSAMDRMAAARSQLAQWENSEKNPHVLIANRLYSQFEREMDLLVQEREIRRLR